MKRYDVIIVGAGPAGSTAARHCGLKGLKTLLLEKEKIPRYKPCAGGITFAAAKELDFDIPDDLIERKCHGMRIVFGKFKNHVTEEHPLAYMVTRSLFDEYLVEKAVTAGAEIQDSETCLSVTPDREKVSVYTSKGEYLSNIVIGADGFFSAVLKSLGKKFDKNEIRFCAITEIPMPESSISDLLNNCVELHYGVVNIGYAWLFPKREYISVGIGGPLLQSKTIIQGFKRFLKRGGFNDRIKPRGCFLPVSQFHSNVYSERVMLAGDAAGFVDAFSGEGIRYAIASGKIAAKTALLCHESNDYTADSVRRYQHNCVESFGKDLKYSHRITEMLFKRPNLFLTTAIINDSIQRRYLSTVTGDIGLEEYFYWIKKRFPYFLFKRFFTYFTSGRE